MSRWLGPKEYKDCQNAWQSLYSAQVHPPPPWHKFRCDLSYMSCSKLYYLIKLLLLPLTQTISQYSDVVQDPQWRETIFTYTQSIEDNETWIIEDLPIGKKPIAFW